jgi:hypothetical protein
VSRDLWNDDLRKGEAPIFVTESEVIKVQGISDVLELPTTSVSETFLFHKQVKHVVVDDPSRLPSGRISPQFEDFVCKNSKFSNYFRSLCNKGLYSLRENYSGTPNYR